MARLKKTLGEQFADRVQGRRGLTRVRVPGQRDEAYTGPQASRALEALGARAMTLDDSIIVAEDFDPSASEDAALYAHEAFHARKGGGLEATHAVHDAEESAARAVEQMVFHQLDAGDADAGAVIHRAIEGGGDAPAGRGEEAEEADNPERVYAKLKAQGRTHDDIVELLAQQVLQALDAQRQEPPHRNPLRDRGSFNF